MTQTTTLSLAPASPAPSLTGVLSLCFARQFPLTLPEPFEGTLPEGCTELIAALGGNLMLDSQENRAVLPAGSAALLSVPCAYTLCADGAEASAAVVRLAGGLAAQLLAPGNPCEIYPQGAAAVREAVNALAVMERENGAVDAFTASAQCYTLLMKLCRVREAGAPGRYSLLVEAAVGIIDEEFAYLDGLDALADRLEVSKPHLIRTFTHEVGISPGKYITRARIEYAKLLLSEPEMPVSFAAEAAGFAGANYFAKVFRRETGLSPSEFQQTVPSARRRSHGMRDEDRLYMP